MALTGLSYWGGPSTGRVSIKAECMTCEDPDKATVPADITFITGHQENKPFERTWLNRMGMVPGHSYRFYVTMSEEVSVGFTKLTRTAWETNDVKVTFEAGQTPVYGLIFEKL